jgi:hypothetical protein
MVDIRSMALNIIRLAGIASIRNGLIFVSLDIRRLLELLVGAAQKSLKLQYHKSSNKLYLTCSSSVPETYCEASYPPAHQLGGNAFIGVLGLPMPISREEVAHNRGPILKTQAVVEKLALKFRAQFLRGP